MNTPGATAGEGTPRPPQTGTTGRGGRQRNRGNRSRYNNRSSRPGNTAAKFKGREADLGDEFVYSYTSGREATDQYARTTEEIIRYCGTKYTNGGDVGRSLEEGTVFVVPEPDDLTAEQAANQSTLAKWKARVNKAINREATLESNLESAYTLIRGQCDRPVLERVEGQTGYAEVNRERDPIGLIRLIKSVMYNYNSRRYRAMTIIGLMDFKFVTQTKGMLVSDYLTKFRTQLEVLKAAGATCCEHAGMIKDELTEDGIDPEFADDDEMEAATRAATDRFEAALFLACSDQSRYGALVQELANDYNQGDKDCYPESLSTAYELMLHDTRSIHRGGRDTGPLGLNFAITGGRTTPGTAAQPNPHPHITCFRCGRNGHYRDGCLESTHVNGTVLTILAPPPATSTASTALPTQTDDGASALTGDVTTDAASALMNATTHTDGFQFMQNGTVEVAFGTAGNPQGEGVHIPGSWILLDSQSTVNVFSSPALLNNIRQVEATCRIRCNAGVTTTNMVGDLPGYPEPVWFDANGIANILSLKRVTEHCGVTYNSEDKCFVVTKPDGSERVFTCSPTGLHYYDTAIHGMAMITTVAAKKAGYTQRAYIQAMAARRLQNIIGRPSDRDFIKIVEGNSVRNCPVTGADVRTALDILGPNLGSLKGKTVRRKGIHHEQLVADVPFHIIKLHRDVTLCFDIMFVNKVPFLVTVSRNVRFGTTERLGNRQAPTVGKALVNVIVLYLKRGFRVTNCHGDGEFEALRMIVTAARSELNVTSEDEHVPEIERYIRTLKERARCVYNVMPFKKIPVLMVVELVHACNYWLNMFPARDGVSSTQSPRRIMTGDTIDYNRHCQLEYGEYVQVHESHDNTMATRTTGAIALRPTGNAQGGHYFMSLMTGARLNRNNWTVLPMPGEVIERVHMLARRSRAANTIEFGWRDGTPIEDELNDVDDLHDEDYTDDDSAASDSDDTGSYAPEPPIRGVEEDNYHDVQNVQNLPQPLQHHHAADSDDDDAADSDGNDDHDESDDEDDQDNDDPNHVSDSDRNEDEDDASGGFPPNLNNDDGDSDDEGADSSGVDEEASNQSSGSEGVRETAGVDGPHDAEGVADQAEETDDRISAAMDKKYGVRTREGLRPRKVPRSPSTIKEGNLHTALTCMLANELDGLAGFSALEHIALTQYNLKQGLKKYGQAAADAVVKEMKQLHDRKTIRPRYVHELSIADKRKALGYLMFIKEKRCGTIKGRGCADGRKQRVYKTKLETSSPTVRTESLLLSCVIDAKEERKVITCDVPGAFMQVDVDEVVHVRLEGPLAELLTKVDPKLYTKYLATEKGKPVMYVQLQKALYGTLSAAMLFWKDLSGRLRKEGYVTNPYDPCVVNKMVNGKQSTVLWHVDDLKLSHVDDAVNNSVVDKLNEWYGEITPVTVTRGDIHDYLGMTIDFSVRGQVSIRMDDYVEDLIDEMPPCMDGVAATPAANHLFTVDENAQKLGADEAEIFHRGTAKLLFVCKRARPDVQTAVAFLCTRVKSPDVDDYKKLRRVVQYLRGTKTMCLTLEADSLQIIKWWVDASFAVHADMRSHTGGTMSLGKGSVYSASTRQKLNTKSSTEAELVGVDDLMSMILWTRQFMEGQGYAVRDNVVYQDNQSAMLLENNGTQSSTKRTRHLDIRYFFVTDRIRAKQLRVEYCNTLDMWADVFTKPLQGAAFIKFRKLILNLPDDKVEKP